MNVIAKTAKSTSRHSQAALPDRRCQRYLAGLVGREWLAILLIATVCYISFSGIVPLTYDEAANYQLFSSHGYAFVMTDYSYPNNHVFFSLLQSLLLPNSLVEALPRSLRIINAAVAGALTLAVTRVARRALDASQSVPARYRPALAAMIGLAVLLASPLFLIYLFIARGYLFGSVILFASIALAIKRPKVAPLLLGVGVALAAWCVPTFAYAAPGIALELFLPGKGAWTARAGKVAMSGSVCGGLLSLLYLPIFPKMVEQSDRWTKMQPLGAFTWSHLELVTAIPSAWAGGLLLLATVLIIGLSWENQGPTRLLRFAAALSAAALSFYAIAELLNATGACPAPFLRNALFIPPFIWLAFFLAGLSIINNLLRYGVLIMVLANAGINMTAFYNSFVTGDPNNFPTFSIQSPSPFERAWDHFDKPEEQLYCTGNAGPLCQIYGPLVARHVTLVNAIPKLPCLQGTWPTSDETAIAVVRGDKGFRLCF